MSAPQATKNDWAPRLIALIFLLFIFLICITGLSEGIKGFSDKDTFQNALETVRNPIVGLMIGMLTTCLLQSSSTTTTLIVGVVASGAVDVQMAVPMVMGANIGTTITNTLVSMGSITRSDEFKRSFAAANIHDVFNLLAVIVLLPLEIMFKIISTPAQMITEMMAGSSGGKAPNPLKTVLKEIIHGIESFFAMIYDNNTFIHAGLFLLSFAMLIGTLYLIVRTMKGVILSRAEVFFDKVLGKNAFYGVIFGMVVTAMVQSSSVTTSIMVPLAGAGVASLRTIFPITLGCNVGTTITALFASLASDNPDALTIALCHVIFNLMGILIIYVTPPIRNFNIMLAEKLAELCAANKSYAIVYVVGIFFVVPGIFFFAFGG